MHEFVAGSSGAAAASQADPIAGSRQTGNAARWGLAAVYLMLAYEWLLAGLNKDLSGTFRAGLANRTRASLVGNPHGWYVSLVKWGVLPRAELFAAVVEIGELTVAAALIWGALLWARPAWFSPGARRWLGVAVSAALLGSAFMELNYYLLAGQGWPWLMTSNPFVEGLSVDGLVMLISVALIPVELAAARFKWKHEPAIPRARGRILIAAGALTVLAVAFFSAIGIFVQDAPSGSLAAAPMATPGDPSGPTIVLVDIAFDPKSLTIPANTPTVLTLVNRGTAVHNFTIDALGVRSGDLQPGESTTVTINALAGAYAYFCSIPGHRAAGMTGTLTVN